MAPAVLSRKSGPESDVWSVGVITYFLLCGRLPFWTKTQAGTHLQVLKNEPDFQKEPWVSIAYTAKDFVKRLSVTDPHMRLTAAQALSHPWLKEEAVAPEKPLNISARSSMLESVKHSNLKQLALRTLASTLEPEKIRDLREQFDAIDVCRNGTLSKDEITYDGPWAAKEVLLQVMESNEDGLVDFDEFVAASLHVHQLEQVDSAEWQHWSEAAFSKFDLDGDGYINGEELEIATGLKGPPLKALLDEAYADGDDRISLPEFQKLLRQANFGSRTNT